jgi:FkbM family methyltransferase
MSFPPSESTLDQPWGSARPPLAARVLTAAARSVPPLPGVKQLAFLLRRLARSAMTGPVDAELWGHRLRFMARGNVSEGRLLFMPSSWDRPERALIRSFARPGTVFVDVGSNFGAYTWWMLHLLGPECSILALEPDPQLNARLRFNLETNRVENVTVLDAAAGTEETTATLHLNSDNRGQNSLLDTGQVGATSQVQVQVRPLARIVEDAGLSRIDIMKVDIEGLEPAVLGAFLDEAPESLWPELLLFERQDRPDYAALEARLADLGYRCLNETRLNLVLHRPRPGSPAT